MPISKIGEKVIPKLVGISLLVCLTSAQSAAMQPIYCIGTCKTDVNRRWKVFTKDPENALRSELAEKDYMAGEGKFKNQLAQHCNSLKKGSKSWEPSTSSVRCVDIKYMNTTGGKEAFENEWRQLLGQEGYVLFEE